PGRNECRTRTSERVEDGPARSARGFNHVRQHVHWFLTGVLARVGADSLECPHIGAHGSVSYGERPAQFLLCLPQLVELGAKFIALLPQFGITPRVVALPGALPQCEVVVFTDEVLAEFPVEYVCDGAIPVLVPAQHFGHLWAA